ncbi:MAG: hypothetical protein Q8M66_06735, partial [Actinomycetota bacterium]|nr:hypothetical protein [Actinomycetota bacterium]
GPSIGDADTGSPGNEIAIANSLEPLDTLSLFDPVTGLLDSYQTSAAAGASAWGTLIADVLPGFAGSETVVALRNNAGMSSINVFAHDGVSPLATRLAHNTGLHFASSSLAFGDVDSATNGRGELVVGNAGTWDETTVGNHVPPSVQVFRVNGAGDNLLAPDTYSAGGVEKAGNTPAVALADLGAVGGTRHPTSVPGDPNETLTAHNSTETAPFDLHVECTDCHNVHEATSTPSPAVANAPDIYGRLKGAWGVQVDYAPASTITYTERQGAVFEYEVCFKCHSGWTRTPDGPDDIAAQFDTRNMSFHLTRPGTTPAANTPGSFVDGAGWTTSSVLHCVDCHGNTEASQPVGPHSSGAAPLLKRPLWGLEPSDEDGLCYSCHKHSVYYTGADDRVPASTSNFYDDVLAEPKLHKRHVNDAGFSCETCHFPHGAKEHEHMIRPGLDWVHLDNGGACNTTCHGGRTINVYSRASALNPEVSATGISTNAGTYLNGDLASVQTAGDADYYQVRELQGNPAPSPLRVTLQFAPATPMATLPSSFRLQGRYDADTGHSLTVQALNHSTSSYVTLGSIPRSTVDDEYVYPLADPNYLSGAGSVTIRITKTTGGNTNNELFIDRAWLRY